MALGIKTGGGSRKGVPNKKNREVREAARVYTVEAIETLAAIMRTGESEPARVSASNALLDRGWGKAQQTIDANINQSITITQERKAEALAGLMAALDKVKRDQEPAIH